MTDARESATTDPSTIQALADYSAFQRDILLHLKQYGPDSGDAIKARLDALYGDPKSKAALYDNLDTLAADGLVDKRADPRDGRTNRYALTDRGHMAVAWYAHRVSRAVLASDDEEINLVTASEEPLGGEQA